MERKAAANLRKHGVSFAEAAAVFDDPLAVYIADWEHGEPRMLTIGAASRGRVLLVVSSEIEDDRVRIISAPRATRKEKRRYEEGEG